MELKQILTLLEAGYTKAEIAAMSVTDSDPDIKKDPEPDAKKDPEPEIKKNPEPNAKKDYEPKMFESMEKVINEFNEKIDSLVDSIAKINIINSAQPDKPDYNDYLANIIDPKYRERK